MSYIRANEFVLQNETVQFVYAHAHELGYTDDQERNGNPLDCRLS